MGGNVAEENFSLINEVESLRKELDRKRLELDIFMDAGKAFTSTLDTTKILLVVVEKAEILLNNCKWSVFLLDENQGDLYLKIAKNSLDDTVNEKNRLKLGVNYGAGLVADNQKTLIVDNVKGDPCLFNEVVWTVGDENITEIESLLCIPMIVNNKTIGVFEMCSNERLDKLDESTLNLLIQLVDHASIAIDKVRLYSKLEEITITDDLTQLYNMRFMDKNLEREISRCKRYSNSVGSIFLDLDYFKTVNDRYGHIMGSKVLKEVALILKKNLREVDSIARFGGDEFVVVLPEVDIEITEMIAERIRVSIGAFQFLTEENLNVSLTASFGVSAFPFPAKDRIDLIDSADAAMYAAKNSGRNRVCKALRDF